MEKFCRTFKQFVKCLKHIRIKNFSKQFTEFFGRIKARKRRLRSILNLQKTWKTYSNFPTLFQTLSSSLKCMGNILFFEVHGCALSILQTAWKFCEIFPSRPLNFPCFVKKSLHLSLQYVKSLNNLD